MNAAAGHKNEPEKKCPSGSIANLPMRTTTAVSSHGHQKSAVFDRSYLSEIDISFGFPASTKVQRPISLDQLTIQSTHQS
ncbi:hypothetical protein [Methylobacter sp.]|jgi:hypothetical protein|uniref:hypothetical protein n=1 Tax=Methylobacter sp. TaxID=2051955 RepID=UPI003DA59D14